MATSNLSLIDSGYEDLGAWTDLAPFPYLGLSSAGYTAGRWTVSPKGKLYTALSLTLRQVSGTGTGTVTVYCVRENSCRAFSTASMPSARRLVEVGSVAADFTTPNAEATVSLSLNEALGAATPLKTVLSFGADANALGLALAWDSVDDVVVAPTALALTYQDAFTGLEGPWKAQGRADHCPKCGLPSTRDRWVRDRFSDRMVCRRCYDPLSFADVDQKRSVGHEREGLGED